MAQCSFNKRIIDCRKGTFYSSKTKCLVCSCNGKQKPLGLYLSYER